VAVDGGCGCFRIGDEDKLDDGGCTLRLLFRGGDGGGALRFNDGDFFPTIARNKDRNNR
jgi:hypothetical protein